MAEGTGAASKVPAPDSAVTKVGVVGGGTMGGGIAQLACLGNVDTVLQDPVEGAAEAARERIGASLRRGVERGRWTAEDAAGAAARLVTTADPALLSDRDLIIEAAPEDLELKREIFARLPVGPVLATNTSSLPVAAIARAAERPDRVVGMHFFNPPPAMPLVEVIRGPQAGDDAVRVADAAARQMGRTTLHVRDAVGFLVNRCGRPFYTEAMRIVDEGSASPAQVDRVCGLGAGFRMGPFELMDLVGLDVGLAVAKSFTERSFGEPRWRPGAAQARLVDAGHLGRKTGRGWYGYTDGSRPRDDLRAAPASADARRVVITGGDREAGELRCRAAAAGFEVSARIGDAAGAMLALHFGSPPPDGLDPEVPLALDCARRSLAAVGVGGAVGFHLLPPVADATLLELTRLPGSRPSAVVAAEEFAAALGLHREWVEDMPGLILGAIVAQIVNEGSFALGEGVAPAADIDLATRVGLNYPFGALEWGDRIGAERVVAVLRGLGSERLDPRYRIAPLLLRAAATGVAIADLVPADSARGVW